MDGQGGEKTRGVTQVELADPDTVGSEAAVGQSATKRQLRSTPWQAATATMAGIGAAAIGALVLTGWTLHIEPLKRILPGLVAMNPLTAVTLLVAATSLWLQRGPPGPVRSGRLKRRTATSLGLLVAVTGFAAMWSQAVPSVPAVDLLLFREGLEDGTGPPSRVSASAALSFVFLGFALFLLDARSATARLPQMLAGVVICIALFALVGYAYAVPQLYSFGPLSPMALHSAVAFLLLGCGLLCSRPTRGWMAVFSAGGPGGRLARRLLPFTVVAGIFAGWLRLEGERRGFYGPEVGVALFAVATVSMFGLLVLGSAVSLERMERARRRLEIERQRFFSLSQDLLCTVGFDGYIKSLNPSWQQTLGLGDAQLLSTPYIELVHPDDRAATLQVAAAAESDQVVAFENRYRCHDGSYRWLQWHATPMPEESLIYCTARDVTAAREAQDVIRELNGQVVVNAIQLEESSAQRAAHDERALASSEDRYRSIVESSQDWIWETDAEGRMAYNNSAVMSVLGYEPDELLGRSVHEHLVEGGNTGTDEVHPWSAVHPLGWNSERLEWRDREGDIHTVESTAVAVVDDAGDVAGYRGVNHDLTEQLRQQGQIEQLSRVRGIRAGLGSAIIHAKTRRDLLGRVCQVATEQGGYAGALVATIDRDDDLELECISGGREVLSLISTPRMRFRSDLSGSVSPARRALDGPRTIVLRQESVSVSAHGEYPVRNRPPDTAQVALPMGRPVWGVLGLYSDRADAFDGEELAVLEQVALEIDHAVKFLANSEQLEYLAFHSATTGLLNRHAFVRKTDAMLRSGDVVVAAVRFPRFAALSESRGHLLGQEMMRLAGSALREAFGDEAIVAHAAEGAVFLVACLPPMASESALGWFQETLQVFGGQPLLVRGERIFLLAEAGIATAPADGRDAATLAESATIALAEATVRRVPVQAYGDELRLLASRKIRLESELRLAVERSEFELHYQPKFNTRTRILTGAEALLRWRHPVEGVISPAEFIPLLEETGLIVPVGEWVMRDALKTAAAWRALAAPPFTVAVNVSARELRHEGFLQSCETCLRPYASEQLLDIEITESMLMDDIGECSYILGRLRQLGCRIAIDDFGTGFSSLSYLARLPADILKIDRSFVAPMEDSREAKGLVRNLIALAHSLSLQVVAEGVERESQATLLCELGSDEMQGYLLGRPMPAQDFERRFLQAT